MSDKTQKVRPQPTTVERLLGINARPPREQLIQFRGWTDGEGTPVVFRLRELSYNRVREIQQMSGRDNMAAAIITAGVVEPDLRDERLQAALGVATPYDVVKRLLRAGEIEDLQAAIEKLSGYRGSTLELLADIEKN